MNQSLNHVLIIAPAGRVDMDELHKRIIIFQKLGIKVEIGENLSKVYGPFAGRDAERLADLQWALDHREADAIWMARGGYGMTRILDQIKPEGFYLKPKTILGYSDITALFLDKRFEKEALFHSSMVESMTEDELHLILALHNDKVQSLNCKSGKDNLSIVGQITGGNLSLLVNQLGIIDTNFFTDKILFLEEIAEYDYKIDRMIIQLKRAGIFKKIKALLLGAFSETAEGRFPISHLYESIIQESELSGIPCIYDLPVGHIHPNYPLIFNTETELEYTGGKLTIKYLS